MHYPVNEIFQTLQGEGYFTGVPAIFVRLQGCPVACPWCDTRHTWTVSPEHRVEASQVIDRSNESASWSRLSAAQIIQALADAGYTARHVVITGGEPCLYDLRELSQALIEAGYQVQLETSGTHPIQIHEGAWVTVSPKIGMKGGFEVLGEAMERADEIKHPVATEKHIEQLDGLLSHCKSKQDKVICLQPISQKKRATVLAEKVCIERNWRLSVQLHKYLGID
ncbi:7-carboxy-7-deazaguanine synthase QueE [Dongshaea marina]|uniref:7-carboxy-7-deazaguanine synthase QueE n=1 Tax=Dongshaea marina TaxID=2047966 RepID=UPI000D3E13A8|nr:7-carboxy-7-deazaguanine synthase QueE [Dongshaea marina]